MPHLQPSEIRHALLTALARPSTLADIIAGSEDTAAATAAIGAAFELTPDQAALVLDQQFSQLTWSKLAAIEAMPTD